MFRLLKVSGDSLIPAYQDGDFVLVLKIPFFLSSLKPGDIIVFRHPVYGTMIKKVDHFSAALDEIFVVGTHEFSVDSRQFGPIKKKDLIGRVIWHIKRPNR